MPLHIAEHLMTGDGTLHTAREQDGAWEVSWLPARALDHAHAVTAMMIAEMCAGPVRPGTVRWVHVTGWAAALGLSPETAVTMASQPPDDTAR